MKRLLIMGLLALVMSMLVSSLALAKAPQATDHPVPVWDGVRGFQGRGGGFMW